MKETKKITDNHAFFVDFALFWAVFGWLAFASALFDFFHAWIFISYSLLAGGYFTWTTARRKRTLKFSADFLIANIAILLFVFVFSLFVTPTVFSGRDQGSISSAAISLAQNHELEFSTVASKEFFSIYGEGKALNFPGFYYTEKGELITQFPLGYISWLGAFYSIFKMPGLIIGNAVCLFLFFISLYIIGKKLLKIRYSALLTLFAMTSFSFVWFFKFTLSENLALALLWIMMLSILYIKKSPDGKSLALYALSASLLAFTRIEGYAFFATSLVVLIADKNIRGFAFQNKKMVTAFVLFFLGIFVANLEKNLPFFTEIGKAAMNIIPGYGTMGDEEKSASSLSTAFRMFQIHTLYGLFLFLVFGAVGMIRSFAEKSRLILIPLAVSFPAMLYLINSNISSDHPWMLRRFAFAVLPLFIFYATYLLKVMFEKNPDTARHPIFAKYMAGILTILMLLVNLQPFARYAFYSEEQGLLEQTRELSQKFSNQDLVLVDRLANGNGWSMVAGPMQTLLGKQAVYFVNPADLEKINLKKFESIYLITPQENISYYAGTSIGKNLKIFEKYSLRTTRLVEKEVSKNVPIIQYPQKKDIETTGYILKFEK